MIAALFRRSPAAAAAPTPGEAVPPPPAVEAPAVETPPAEAPQEIPGPLAGLAAASEQLRARLGALAAGEAEPGTAYAEIIGHPPPPARPPRRLPITSKLCVQADFATDACRYWMAALRALPGFHRKTWELFFILQALHERDCIGPGKQGLTFGVGREAIPAVLAARGCRILAADQAPEMATAAGWADSEQHAAGLATLPREGICEEATFAARVAFRAVDMNSIPADLAGRFDFCWSACCLEHLGSLEHGLRFIERSLETLRPGGTAVHTTGYNLSSNDETVESPGLSLYRRRDIEG